MTAPQSGTGPPLDAALLESPADETELVWLETTRNQATSHRDGGKQHPRSESTLFVRVLERGRLGTHRTGGGEAGDISTAIRQAIAQSRSRDTLHGLPHLPADDTNGRELDGLLDTELQGLEPRVASQRIAKGLRKGEVARLGWGTSRIVVANSRGVSRRAEVTHCSLEIRCGTEPGAGHAAASSRSLAGIDAQSVLERARRRHGGGETATPPADKTAVLLAPEATIRLLSLLNHSAFTASAYQEGSSFLREHLGVQVFDRRVNLRDDGTDPAGLPFPFDFEGTSKRPIDLIVKGTPKTPALDQRQAAVLGLTPTGHAVAGNEALAQHLFFEAGEDSHDDLLERSDGGVFIGWLDRAECFDAPRVRFRATARGVRTIEGGRLGAPLPDLVWEDSLLHALSNLSGLGSETVTWSLGGFGALSAPALALGDVVGLEPING